MDFWTLFFGTVLGIGGNLVASSIWERFKQGPTIEENWKTRLQSSDQSTKEQASRECFAIAFRWYVIANIMWVISSMAWALEALEYIGLNGAIIGQSVMVGTALLSLFFFGVALSWVSRFLRNSIKV